jgi:hypothetical protein
LYLAWRHGGADPYRLYNALDGEYRPLAGDACPDCEGLGRHVRRRFIDLEDGSVTTKPVEIDCVRGVGAGVIPGRPRRPLFPQRVQAFVYACGLAAEAEERAMAGVQATRRAMPRRA